MTDNERQRQMDFIVQQQAQLTLQLNRLTERVDSLADTQLRAERRWEQTEKGIRALLAIAEVHEREIAAQGEQIKAQGEQMKALSAQIEASRMAGRETDERLNALINTVERIISERRGGSPEQA